jgi:glycosyltransferase involved in cell wall biosynthesis
MLDGSRIAVIVPAFNEERLIAKTIRSIPSFVDDVVLVDDASTDGTVRAALAIGDDRTSVVQHSWNRGVGAAIVSGYRAALARGADVLAVMAGDAQMDPRDLMGLVGRVARGEADYAKGDRLCHPEVRVRMPTARRLVGAMLSRLTRWAAGLEALSDSQCGYTAISSRALEWIELDSVWPRYGYPNDLIGRLALAGARIKDVPVRPVYATETSGLRPWHVLRILRILAATWSRRMASTFRPRARDPRWLSRNVARVTGRNSGQSLPM